MAWVKFADGPWVPVSELELKDAIDKQGFTTEKANPLPEEQGSRYFICWPPRGSRHEHSDTVMRLRETEPNWDEEAEKHQR